MIDLIGASDRLVASRKKAVDWLLDSIDSTGRPKGSETGNGWSRLPWTLALAGETGAAHAVLEWAAHEAIEPSGNFRDGPALESSHFNAYKLGQFAMGALLLERYDVAGKVLNYLEATQAPDGGARIEPLNSEQADIAEVTTTGQVGLAALLGGREEMAKQCRDWIVDCLNAQPELPDRLYAARVRGELLIQPIDRLNWVLVVNYNQGRQAFHQSGMAAAFLGMYALQTGDAQALEAAHRYLALNIEGTEEQFTDLAAVQACKVGWGAAVVQMADPSSSYQPLLVRMADWFIDRQAEDGSWTFSKFLAPTPTIVQTMMKTAEHAMEVTALIAALNVSAVRG